MPAPSPSFKSWLRKTPQTDDPVGDLLNDMRHDPDLPNFTSLKQISQYVSRKSGSDPNIMATVRPAWSRYRDRKRERP